MSHSAGRRMAALTITLLVVAAALAATLPARAEVTEDDLRTARLAFEDAQAELEAETWNLRTLTETAGLMRFEYEEYAVDAESARTAHARARQAALRRILERHFGSTAGDWADRALRQTYLAAVGPDDRTTLETAGSALSIIESDLALLLAEVEGFETAQVDSQLRLEFLTAEVARLDWELTELAVVYEAESRTTTTTTVATTAATTATTVPTTTTTASSPTTAPPPTTSTTLDATSTTLDATTSTTTVASSTTTLSDASSTTTSTTVPASTTTTTVFVPPTGDIVCPVAGPHHFVDSFGAPRSGGRTHAGVDMLADRGTPLVAIESGTVGRLADGGLGGITVWLVGDSGTEYYYAHLDDWAPGLATGQSVSAGTLLGYVGSTGNAPEAYPHLHFEIHPDGGAAVNPYPVVDPLCS